MRLILHSKPWITEEDLAAVRRAVESCMIAQGERTSELESTVSRWVGAAGGVATGSGAAALALSMMGLGVGPGHEVILPSYVCPSVMEAVRTVGAEPVLCDVGPDWVVTADKAASRLSKRTRAIIVPHMYGIFADVASFLDLGVAVIEDCAQAVDRCGARPMRGDVSIFSFHPTKCLTTGEGGMVVSTNRTLVDEMRRIRDGSGSTIRGRLLSPLSDVASALGLSQLARYPTALDRRASIAERYKSALVEVAPHTLRTEVTDGGMYFRFPMQMAGGINAFAESFLKERVVVRQGVDQLLHRVAGLPDADFPDSTRLFDSTVSLPIYPALEEAEVEQCLAAVRRICSRTATGSPSQPSA